MPQRMRLFSQDQRVAIRITSRNPAQRRIIVLDVFPDLQTSTSTQPPNPRCHRPNSKTLSPRMPVRWSSRPRPKMRVVLRLTPADGA